MIRSITNMLYVSSHQIVGESGAKLVILIKQYVLRGILFHDGALVAGKHLYAYVRNEAGWWKIQEHEATRVSILSATALSAIRRIQLTG